jgi:hypothetical protein
LNQEHYRRAVLGIEFSEAHRSQDPVPLVLRRRLRPPPIRPE